MGPGLTQGFFGYRDHDLEKTNCLVAWGCDPLASNRAERTLPRQVQPAGLSCKPPPMGRCPLPLFIAGVDMSEVELEQATAREDLCRFLAACYYEPDAVLAEEKVFESMAAAAQRLDPELAATARRLGEAFAAQELQALLVDYTRLFLGPPSPLVAPYGSTWLGGDGTVMPESAVALEGLYGEAGFEIDEELGETPDHVAVELEFLYLLTFKQNEARRAGEEVAIAGWDQLHDLFLRGHVGAWISRFAAAVRDQAETAFYRELADLTVRFLRTEVERLPRP
jgi:TorA maturation chaperone TorD